MANAMKTASVCLVSIVLGLLGCSENARPKLVAISGNDDMKFSVNKLDVKAGQTVALTLTNVGELPKEAMSHNWVLLAKGTEARKLIEAGTVHPESDYITSELATHIVAKTRLLGPLESDTITFAAPSGAGDYEYVCTFPEHYARGMRGIMTVIAR
jgi:azurin